MDWSFLASIVLRSGVADFKMVPGKGCKFFTNELYFQGRTAVGILLHVKISKLMNEEYTDSIHFLRSKSVRALPGIVGDNQTPECKYRFLPNFDGDKDH